MVNRFPWCVLNIELPAREVDVNVHPSKTEIRFRNPLQVKQMLVTALKNASSNKKNIPKVFSSPHYKKEIITNITGMNLKNNYRAKQYFCIY